MKNKMRRINIIITVLALMLTLTACGKSEFGVTENSWKHMTLTAQNADKDAFVMVGSLDVADGEQISLLQKHNRRRGKLLSYRSDKKYCVLVIIQLFILVRASYTLIVNQLIISCFTSIIRTGAKC